MACTETKKKDDSFSKLQNVINEITTEKVIPIEQRLAEATQTPEWEDLYLRLNKMKDEEGFKVNGFGAGGPYNGWLTGIESFRGVPKPNWSFMDKLAMGELLQLGMEYVSSKGEETEYTTFWRNEYNKQLNSEPKKTISKKKEGIVENGVIGKWKVKSNYIHNGAPLYILYYEIIKDDKGYLLIYTENSTLEYRLKTKGDKLYQSNLYKDHGNYYKINDGMLEFWDGSGIIEDDTITKIK